MRQFRAWAESHDRTTLLLSDEAVSRASIYPDRIGPGVLVDTSVLTRALQPHHALYGVTDRAMERLLEGEPRNHANGLRSYCSLQCKREARLPFQNPRKTQARGSTTAQNGYFEQ